jgi:glycosyltransferase involved in cell wall biosynthesis
MKISVVIPAYNESMSIEAVVNSVKEIGDVVVVDDGSSDLTGDIARRVGAIIVSHKNNLGYDMSIQSGLRKAIEIGSEFVITFDADGQHDPSILNEIVRIVQEKDVDLVLGIRNDAARLSEEIFNWYTRIVYGVPDILCGLKGYKIDIVKKNQLHLKNSIGTGLAIEGIKAGSTFVTIPVRIFQRNDLDQSRMGHKIKANTRIFKAFLLRIYIDIHTLISSKI